MAGDWIKMRVGLTTHPRVMRIAECLLANDRFAEWSGMHYCVPSFPPNLERQREERHAALRVTRYITVTGLLKFWSYANEHVKGEFVGGIWPEDVDEITGIPGFAEAIEASGWAQFSDEKGGMTLPNFAEHNTAVLERSAASAERQKRYRERKKAESAKALDVTRDVTSNAREEKNREEKKETKPRVAFAPPNWVPLVEWNAWLEVRRKNKAPSTDRALSLAVAELTRLKDQGHDPADVLNSSVLNGYRGLFPPKGVQPKQEPTNWRSDPKFVGMV